MLAARAWLLVALTIGLHATRAVREAEKPADSEDLQRMQAARDRRQLEQQMDAAGRQAKKFRRRLGRFGHPHVGAPIDPDRDAQAMLAACGSEDFGSGEEALRQLQRCVGELQSYAKLSRQGLQGSLQAEQVFVTEYEKAAKYLAFIGDTNSLWSTIQKDQHAALTYLLTDADKAGSTAKGLKVFGALRPTTTQKPVPPFPLEDSDEEEDFGEEDEDEDEEAEEDSEETAEKDSDEDEDEDDGRMFR
ncbi:unnamed protein product [Symbiodinium sp. CCMP2592]|nr:unnamed protein product [Symbiodinium sp. CCMP2592]